MSAQAIRLTEVDIDNALSGHLGVVFQPVFGLSDGALMRVETFVRWDHPGLGLLPPGAFVSFFEAQGRMGELTRYVLRRSIDAYVAWRGTEGPGLSVNLAQSDLSDPTFAADLVAILAEAGLPPRLLTLECPPFAPDTAPADAALTLGRLARAGCPLAAEVRGRAGDVLTALDPFPFAEVKTGGSAILRFARTAKGGPGLTAISELLDLAARHGARAVAVGVEDEASARALAGLGFEGGQGKLFGGTGALGEVVTTDATQAVRATLGLAPLSGEELAALEARPAPEARAPAKLAPLILGDAVEAQPAQATAEPDDALPDPDVPDPTMLAIMRLKAKKIAAKKAALERAQAAQQDAESEAEAARQASGAARRLQERLAAEIDAEVAADEPAAAAAWREEPAGPKADATPLPRRPRPQPASSAPAPTPSTPMGPLQPRADRPRRVEARGAMATQEDAEAGVLLSQNLAEIALGVSRQTSFAEGIRLDGYAPSGGGAAAALQGAVAPEAEPEVRAGEAEPAEFVDVASAIHAILADLPVPEDVKPRLIRSAEMPLASRGAPLPGPEAAPVPAEALEADLSAADTLDAVVAASPEITEAEASRADAHEAAPAEDVPLIARPRRPRRRTNLLTRKYRITHFWPRSWVRAVRRARAARAAKAEERIGDAEALAA